MAIAFAILTALANALGSILQRLGLEQSSTHPEASAKAGAVATSPLWIGGVLLMAAGFGLQAIALHVGSIVVVQPLLLIELPVIVVVLVGWFGQHIAPRDRAATFFATLGLGLALGLFAPDDGTRHPSLTWWLTVSLVTVGSALAIAFLAVVAKGGRRAFFFGLSAATGFGLVAALTKEVGDVAVAHPEALLSTWQLWALVIVGAGSFVAMQRAFEAGSFAASQSALILGTPLLSIVVGGALFGVTATTVLWRQVLGLLATLVVVASIAVVLRSPIVAAAHDPHATRLTGKGWLARRK
jgi:hypothetical protein